MAASVFTYNPASLALFSYPPWCCLLSSPRCVICSTLLAYSGYIWGFFSRVTTSVPVPALSRTVLLPVHKTNPPILLSPPPRSTCPVWVEAAISCAHRQLVWDCSKGGGVLLVILSHTTQLHRLLHTLRTA